MHLSKSDFKACFDCRTKLYYRKNRYPSAADDNEYLQFLADGGFMVELAAKSAYPAGVDLVDVRDPAQSHAKTAELLATDGATIFEAGVVTGKYHVRIDILRRQGKTLELIEVKSSGVADDGEDDAASPFLNKDKVTIAARWKKIHRRRRVPGPRAPARVPGFSGEALPLRREQIGVGAGGGDFG